MIARNTVFCRQGVLGLAEGLSPQKDRGWWVNGRKVSPFPALSHRENQGVWCMIKIAPELPFLG
jgi:hypothetical protein